jgi:hemerythrin superfamily protein
MERVGKLSSIMFKDHLRLLSLLHRLEIKNKKDLQVMYEEFENFKWNIEKHFFVEEKTIFSSFKTRKDGAEPYNLFLEIAKQHTEILNELNLIKKSLLKNQGIDGLSLRDLLIKHQKFEEKAVYPRLDEELDENEKDMIINRINEIIYLD